MIWTRILDILADLGAATTDPLWLPVLAWTGLALPLWVLLERTDRLHPHAEYRLTQVLLAALPIGIAAAGVAELLPDAAQPPALPTAGIVVLPSIEPTVEVTSTSTPSWHWMHAAGLVTAIALIAGLVGLGRLALDAVAAVRVRGTVEGTAATPLQARVDRLRETLGIGRPVRALVTSEAAVPVTLGGLRPLILLPEGLTENPEALRTTLVHECVHVRRWDDLAHVAERIVAALFAVHPLVQRLRRRIVEARERACDAAVLDGGHTSSGSYARLLVAFAEGNPRPDRLAALSLSESPSSLKDRLSAMRSSVSTLLSSRRALGPALVAIGLVLTLGVVACSDTVGPSEDPSTSPESATANATDGPVYMVVEDQPELVGGMKALQESVQYPKAAKKTGLEGRVIVKFVVGKNGAVKNPKVVRSVNKLLDKAAIEAVKAQKFKPGRQDGEPVPVQMSLPVTFRLPGESSTDANQRNPMAKPTPPVKADGDGPYMVVEDQPELVGGMKALQEDATYPEMAREAGIEGRVIVQLTVDKDGTVQNPTVVRGVNEVLNRAAVEAVKKQTFKPGRQDGKPVSVRMALPVIFRLPGQDTSKSGAASDAGEIDVPANGSIDVEEAPPIKNASTDLNLPPYRPPGMRIKGGLEALQEAIRYPPLAHKAGIEGQVVVRFTIDEGGQVQNPEIAQGAHKVLNEAALTAIQKVSFEPVESAGQPTTATMTLPITFNLPDDSPSTSSRQSNTESKGDAPTTDLDRGPRRVYDLKASRLVEGSVAVTANGETLQKGSDYHVDPEEETVTLTDESDLDAETDLEISYEVRQL